MNDAIAAIAAVMFIGFVVMVGLAMSDAHSAESSCIAKGGVYLIHDAVCIKSEAIIQ